MSRYTLSGAIRTDNNELSKEVHCRIASLSEQDLDNVVGLSDRAAMGISVALANLLVPYKVFFAQCRAQKNLLVLSSCFAKSPRQVLPQQAME